MITETMTLDLAELVRFYVEGKLLPELAEKGECLHDCRVVRIFATLTDPNLHRVVLSLKIKTNQED